jgi:hypothetical protein
MEGFAARAVLLTKRRDPGGGVKKKVALSCSRMKIRYIIQGFAKRSELLETAAS